MKKFCFEFNRVETSIYTVFLAVKCGISQQVPFATVINGKRPADHINRFNYAVLTVLSHSIIVLHSFAQSAVQLQLDDSYSSSIYSFNIWIQVERKPWSFKMLDDYIACQCIEIMHR